MRGSVHAPPGRSLTGPGTEEGDEQFIGRDCYVFNVSLRPSLNDTRCGHCRFYLTARCPHIDEFIEDVEDLSPE